MNVTVGVGAKVLAAVTGVALAATTVGAFAGRDDAPGASAVVARVVDGDTVVLRSGEYVRLIGIDTPEKGDCGSKAATRRLRRMVEGQSVVIANPESVDDEDRYGRLLRYIEVYGEDAGRVQINAALAVARYDSRDGYDWHPREASYRAAGAVRDSRCQVQQRARKRRWDRARSDARAAGITPWVNERLPHLRSRIRTAELKQVAREREAAKRERQAKQRQAERRRRAREQAERRHAEREQVARERAAREREKREAAEPEPEAPSGGGFVPPAGWTTDALTPGYTGCRQGYPGGKINGVYVWKKTSC